MSASREKKNRKDLAASGVIDPKKIREAEERAKHRRTNILYGSIAGVFVLVAAFLLLWNSHILQRGATAVTINGAKYSAAEVDYYYHYTLNNLVQDQYAAWLGVSSGMDLNAKMNDTARSYLQVSQADITWDAYLKGEAVGILKYIHALSREAEKNGFTLTEEQKENVNAEMDALRNNAKNAGMSENAYLKALYGNNMTRDVFKKVVEQSILANSFRAQQQEGLTYTAEDLENYYKEHKNTLDAVSYESIFFNGTPETKKDDEGKDIPATDEEKETAKKAAADNAAAALERIKAGESPEAVAKAYDNATYANNEKVMNSSLSYSLPGGAAWLFNEERKADDVTTQESGSNVYLLVFHDRSRTDARTIDVRHILFSIDKSGLDNKSPTYDEDLKNRKDAAKTKADEALAKWKAGEATQDSFAALANELSEDPGSNTKGGLYEKVSAGEMVTPFNDWCFDESRKSGDTDVVETDYGYHVMYFVGDNVPHWQKVADNNLRSEDHNAWLEELVKSYTVKYESGMKYVG